MATCLVRYHDLGCVDSLARLVQQRLPEQERDVNHLGIHEVADGRFISKYPLGVALSQVPWFAGAHLYSTLEDLPTGGQSWPYQEAAMLAGVAYAILGLWVLLLPVLLYVTFSWGQWWYGWGFSTRPLVSCYPLLALPLRAALASVRFSRAAVRPLVRGFVVFCILLNLWQGWQYVSNVLPGDGMTLALYKERFFQVPRFNLAEPTPYTPPPPPKDAW